MTETKDVTCEKCNRSIATRYIGAVSVCGRCYHQDENAKAAQRAKDAAVRVKKPPALKGARKQYKSLLDQQYFFDKSEVDD